MTHVNEPNRLKDIATHYDFGRNWASFASGITAQRIELAQRSLARLLPADVLQGGRFFDIGCGSGLSMLAAVRLGAASVRGVDLDPNSVSTSLQLLQQQLPGGNWQVEQKSVFELRPETDGQYDIVHSWGVLHHTGDMWQAIEAASRLVARHGRLVLALYRKTPLCGAWVLEKRLYTAAPKAARALIRAPYKAAYCAGLVLTGRNPRRYIAEYQVNRGMDWHHDVDDWLGGYPYESVAPIALMSFLDRLGFDVDVQFEHPAAVFGLFGTHCDEFVMRRRN